MIQGGGEKMQVMWDGVTRERQLSQTDMGTRGQTKTLSPDKYFGLELANVPSCDEQRLGENTFIAHLEYQHILICQIAKWHSV